MIPQSTNWDEWKEELDDIGVKHEWDTQAPEWREYYDEGFSPRDALQEDMNAAIN